MRLHHRPLAPWLNSNVSRTVSTIGTAVFGDSLTVPIARLESIRLEDDRAHRFCILEAPMSLTTTVDTVADDVIRVRYLFANAYIVGSPEGWVLVDAALPNAHGAILEAANHHIGADIPPSAIVLTHGHFDHVGALPELLGQWSVPVLAHELELPHLLGEEDYPPPDPTVGKGAMALMSFTYPNKAIDLGERVRALPTDHHVPGMPGWRWIHTPGHSNGHVSFYRERDGLLLAGDAFVTVQQESLYAVATQQQEVHGPPAYFTADWDRAFQSVQELHQLKPRIAATGHGTPMSGEALATGLTDLVVNFDEVAVPRHGRYVPD